MSTDTDLVQRIIGNLRYFTSKQGENLEYVLRNRAEYEDITRRHAELFFRDWLMHDTVLSLPREQIHFFPQHGYCDICQKEVDFRLENIWGCTTEGLGCSSCGLNMRLRYIFSKIRELYRLGHKVYISEEVTRFHAILKDQIPGLVGSEYDPASELKNVRHEDSTCLSFADDSFDLVLSNDVFEHVFDYRAAFREAYRVLKPGGQFLFHIPFHVERDETTVRAVLYENGEIQNLEPPVYHGNPISEQGALLINDFGWDILDDVSGCGFQDVHIKMRRDYEKGYLGALCFVFYAKK